MVLASMARINSDGVGSRSMLSMLGMLGGSPVRFIRARLIFRNGRDGRLILETIQALSGPDTTPHRPIYISYDDAG
jgi:hypothetical protein